MGTENQGSGVAGLKAAARSEQCHEVARVAAASSTQPVCSHYTPSPSHPPPSRPCLRQAAAQQRLPQPLPVGVKEAQDVRLADDVCNGELPQPAAARCAANAAATKVFLHCRQVSIIAAWASRADAAAAAGLQHCQVVAGELVHWICKALADHLHRAGRASMGVGGGWGVWKSAPGDP